MSNQDDLIAELRRTNAELLQRISELELQLAKALKNSSNSSKSDIVKPPKKQAKRRKKATRGGQKGHERKLRKPLPPERVDETIDYAIGRRSRAFEADSDRRVRHNPAHRIARRASHRDRTPLPALRISRGRCLLSVRSRSPRQDLRPTFAGHQWVG